jgi:hypothetical protein
MALFYFSRFARQFVSRKVRKGAGQAQRVFAARNWLAAAAAFRK